ENPAAVVTEVACPRFVPLIEAGELDSVETLNACREYLRILARADCRTIVLGCTHYPFLVPALRSVGRELFADEVRFIDPAEELMDMLPLSGGDMPRSSRQKLLT